MRMVDNLHLDISSAHARHSFADIGKSKNKIKHA